jgi:hypothetical protein
MFCLDILKEGAHDNATEVIKRLGQGLVTDVIPPRSIDPVAKRRADQAEPYVLGKASPSLDMVRGDEIYRGVPPKFTDGEQISVNAGVVCPCQ